MWADLRCTGVDEARWIRSLLAAHEIEALIPDEHTLALPLDDTSGADAVRVLVRSDQLERALEILDRVPWTEPSNHASDNV